LPSFVLLCLMSGVYVEFGDVTVVEGVVSGLGAAVVALVAAAVTRVGSRVIHTPAAVGLAAAAFLAIAVGVPFPIIIALAAGLGYLAGRSNPSLLGRPAGHGADDDDDDSQPTGEEVRLRRRFIQGLVIWLVPVGVLVLIGGLVGQLAGFFTIAALVTFGGA
jgi:chromate transporter